MNLETGVIRADAESGPDGFDAAGRRARRRRVGVVAGLVLIAALAAIWFLVRGHKAPAPAAPILPRITVLVPGRQSVTNAVSATGTIGARREEPVGVAGEGGMVARVLVDAGDWVRAGQTLAVIDRSVQTQQTAQMGAQIASAQADAKMMQSDLDRAQKLVGRGFISQATVEQKLAARDAANARVKLARAQFGEMSARMARLDIHAPSDGLVLARNVEAGQIVSSGSPALFRIARGGELEMQARLAESDLARLRVGSPAQVTPVGTSRPFPGRIWQLSPTIDPTSRQGVARIALRYDQALRPGGFASATISGMSGISPLLPESAVLSDAGGNYVYVVGKDDRVERRPVTVGEVDDKGVTVVKGLSGSERVIESAGAFLNPGDKITPVRSTGAR